MKDFSYSDESTQKKEIEKLPSEWCIRVSAIESDHPEVSKWRNGSWIVSGFITNNKRWYKHPTGIEITLEQFKKFVLKENVIEQRIIGYKLIKPEYEKAAIAITGYHEEGNTPFTKFIETYLGAFTDSLREAGVLDNWFTPIYETSYPNIIINGFKAEFFPDYVKFGCATISKFLFKELSCSNALIDEHNYGNIEITAVTIGRGVFTKAEIEEIAKYYINL